MINFKKPNGFYKTKYEIEKEVRALETKHEKLKTLIRSAAESDNCYDILFEYLKGNV